MNIATAIVQFRPILGNPEKNMRLIDQLIQPIENARLIVLPELASTGYNFKSKKEAFDLSEEIDNSTFVQFLTNISREKNTHIVAGINERDGDKLYNTAVLVNKDGSVGKYRKAHLFVNEKDIFEPGNLGFPVFELPGFTIGISICFDYLFPEIWRMMAQQGADIICHPSNLITGNAHKVTPALALINKVYILTANRYGTEGDLTFCGNSIVADPSGNITHRAAPDMDEVVNCTLDLNRARNKWVTARNHAFEDRRPDIYE